MKETIKHDIIKYLEGHGHFVYGGSIARNIHELRGCKESVVERRCRELAEEGVLEKAYEQVDGKGPRVVMYRLAPEKEPISQYKQLAYTL